MAANTYPDPRVARLVNEFAVPVQFNVAEDPGARARYHGYWTPCMSYQDADGAEYRKSFGSLNAEQFLAEFSLARGLRFVNSGRFEEGVDPLEQALTYTETVPLRHAENLYWLAVARFEASGRVEDLLGGWEQVQRLHPDTEWDSKTRLLIFD